MLPRILTVTVNPALDKTVVHGKEVVSAGGKGVNVARALQKLGFVTVTTGLLGGGAGARLRRLLVKERIKSCFFKIKGTTRINWAILDRKKNETTRILELGPEISRMEWGNFKKCFDRLLSGAAIVAFSGRKIPGLTDKDYAGLAQMAKRKNIPVILDMTGRALKLSLRAKPLLVRINLSEAEEVLKQRLNTDFRKKKAVKFFLNRGVQNVIISCGKKGAVGAEKAGAVWFAQAPVVRANNEVGSGDAMIAGFLYGYCRRKTFAENLAMAVAAGTTNAQGLIPGRIAKQRFLRLVPSVRLNKI